MLKTKKNYRNEIIFFILMALISFAVFNLGHKKILAAENGQVNLEAWSLTEKKASNGSTTTNNNDVIEATLNYNSSVESGFKDIVIPNATDFQSNYPVLQKVWIDSNAMALVANNANKEGGSLRISDTDGNKVFAKDSDWIGIFESNEFITSIDLSGFDTSNATDMSGMFAWCSSLSSVNLSGLDTSNATGMTGMFVGCKSLSSIDLSGLDTSNVTNMRSMFEGCESLSSINLSGLDTSSVSNMCAMFFECSSLSSIDLSGFDTSNVTDMSRMFAWCSALSSVNLSGWNTSNVTDMSLMFCDCSSLSSIDLSGWDMSNVDNMEQMFDGCSTKKLRTRKYLFGYSDGTIKPENYVTNAEFATVIYRLMNNGEKINYDKLEDIGIEKSDWFADAVAYLIDDSRQIINITDKNFRPNKNITSYEVLDIIHNVLKFYGADENFDIDQDLDSNITRAKMSEIIFKAFDRKSNPGKKEYSDLDNDHWAYKYLIDASE